MSMTDPIADLLTRIRNAIAADHEYAEIPASKFKAEIARILDEQGYIESYSVEPARVGEVLRVKLKYTEDRRSVISGLKRVSRPGRRTYTHSRRGAEGARRHGHRDRLDVEGRHDRTPGAPGGRRWRGRGVRLVSRIGKQPIAVPEGVQVQIEPEIVRVNGPRGELSERKSREIAVEQQDSDIVVTRPTDRKEHRALHGLTRSLIANMIEGVTSGFEKRLEIQGVGYRAALRGKNIELSVGYSHPVQIEAPDGVEFEVPQPTQVIVKGSSKQAVGEIAAQIRKVRPPEPYKGKGIRYVGEYVQRKVGKRA